MADEFRERPYSGIGGVAGEFLSGGPPAVTTVVQSLVIPEWDGSSFVEDEEPEPERVSERPPLPKPPWAREEDE
jgi:hypothetical protein